MKGKSLLCAFLAVLLLMLCPASALAETEAAAGGTLSLSAPSVILLEASTDTVIYENNAD